MSRRCGTSGSTLCVSFTGGGRTGRVVDEVEPELRARGPHGQLLGGHEGHGGDEEEDAHGEE